MSSTKAEVNIRERASRRKETQSPYGVSSYSKAGDRIRTGDPQLGKLMLYQLSYARNGR